MHTMHKPFSKKYKDMKIKHKALKNLLLLGSGEFIDEVLTQITIPFLSKITANPFLLQSGDIASKAIVAVIVAFVISGRKK